MRKKNVLFVCVHNSARSQMAEAFFNQICGDSFISESAGLEPGELNPLVIKTMQEKGLDISNNQTKTVFDFVKSGKLFAYVVTVCDESNAERCPIFAGVTQRVHWSFPDPGSLTGSEEEKLVKIREIRDAIEAKIAAFCEEINAN